RASHGERRRGVDDLLGERGVGAGRRVARLVEADADPRAAGGERLAPLDRGEEALARVLLRPDARDGSRTVLGLFDETLQGGVLVLARVPDVRRLVHAGR